MQEVQFTVPPIGAPKKVKVEVSIWVKLRPVYPFLVITGIWQIAAMQAKGNLGKLFPTVDAIVFRTWELITGPLVRAVNEAISAMGTKVDLSDLGFLNQLYYLLFQNPLGFTDQLYYLFQSPLLWHVLATAWRLPFSFVIASIAGVIVGILMGRYAFWESFFVPVLSVLLPIPAIAWTPIAVIWFGIGDQTVIIITSFASFLPIAMAVWTGVKTVNPVWIRAAQSMNANKMTIFRTVVLPGSLPMILSGMRIGLARAWRAGVGAEAFAGIRWGLSAGIFDAQEYLDIAFMMVAIAVLGLFGYALEKIIFQPIESRTVIRWGMMEAMGGQDKKI